MKKPFLSSIVVARTMIIFFITITALTACGSSGGENRQVANTAPVADDQDITIDEDEPAVITLGSDSDNDPLTCQTSSGPTHGTLSGTAPDMTYTPDADYNGNDSFSFYLNDGTADSNTATVSIIVNAVNDSPVADDQSIGVDEDTPVGITLAGSDSDNDPCMYQIANGPSHGTLSGTPPQMTYTPDVDYNGNDSFSFYLNDGTADSNSATVSIIVNAVNDPPVASDDILNLSDKTQVSGTLSGSDIDGDNLPSNC